MSIAHVESDEQIAATFDVVRQLRPAIAEEECVGQVSALMANDAYKLAVPSDDGEVRAASRSDPRCGCVFCC